MIYKIIIALVCIESGGDLTAYNAVEEAVGVLQIRPIMVREVNRILGEQRYKLIDCKNATKSFEIASIFLSYQVFRYRKRYGIPPGKQTLAASWQSGSIFKPCTKEYKSKLKELGITDNIKGKNP